MDTNRVRSAVDATSMNPPDCHHRGIREFRSSATWSDRSCKRDQRNLALVDFFSLVGPTDPLGFLESGFLGTSSSIRNSFAHFGQLRRDIKSLPMIVPMTKGIRQCGQEMYS